MNANKPASIVDRNRVIIEGTLRAMSIPVTTGTISNQGVMVNLVLKAAANSVICWVLFVSYVRPITVNIMIVMINEGMVVIII